MGVRSARPRDREESRAEGRLRRRRWDPCLVRSTPRAPSLRGGGIGHPGLLPSRVASIPRRTGSDVVDADVPGFGARRRRRTDASDYLLRHGESGALDRVRLPDPVRAGRGRPGDLGRGRQVRRERELARRHGRGCLRDPARRCHDQHDDQRPREHRLGDVSPHRGGDGRPRISAGWDDPERHPEGVHRPEGVPLSSPPALRLVTDTIEYATRHTPRWNPVSISGYDIREAGVDRGPRARLHARGRAGLCRRRDRARARRR